MDRQFDSIMDDHDFEISPFELLAGGNTSSSSDKCRPGQNSVPHGSGQSKYQSNFNEAESKNNTSGMHYDSSEQSKSGESGDGDVSQTLSRSWNLVRTAARQSINAVRGGSPRETQGLFNESSSPLILLRRTSIHADDVIFSNEAPWATGPMIGRGSYGKVYQSALNEKKHAIKIIIFKASDLSKVITEAEMGCMLTHPSIVRTFGYRVMEYTDDLSAFRPSSSQFSMPLHFGDSKDAVLGDSKFKMYKLALIQELCDIGPLRDVIPKAEFFKRPDIRKLDFVTMISMDICRALMYFESEGMCHNDLSSNNVLLATDPSSPLGMRAKLVDFGLCGPHNSSAVIGTIPYTAPELLVEGLASNSSKTDIYSLGVLMLEMWIGKDAWCPLKPMQIVYHLSGGMRLTVPEDVPESLRRLLERCLRQH
jgi:hypothetical protein